MPKINDKLRIIKNGKQRKRREATYEARLKANNEDRPKCWLTAQKRGLSRRGGGSQQAPGCSHLFDYKPTERSDNGVSLNNKQRKRERETEGDTEREIERGNCASREAAWRACCVSEPNSLKRTANEMTKYLPYILYRIYAS